MNPTEAAKTAIEALTTDKVEINQQNLFAWLAENPPDPDTDFDDLDDYLESFETAGLDPDDDESDDDDESEGDE